MGQFSRLEQHYSFDQDEVHDVYRRWHRSVDPYPGERILVGEVFMLDPDPSRVATYVRPDSTSPSTSISWLSWGAAPFRASIEATLLELEKLGATATWILSNHDVVRHGTRYAGGTAVRHPSGRGQRPSSLLALPGAVCLYQGEELGLEEVDVPPEARQDPVYRLGSGPGRDGCRVPIP